MQTSLKIIATNANTEHLQGEVLTGELILKDEEQERGNLHVFTVGNKIYEFDIQKVRAYEFGMVFLGVLIDLDTKIGGRVCAQFLPKNLNMRATKND